MRPALCLTACTAAILIACGAAHAAPTDQGGMELSGALSWGTASYSYEDEDVLSVTILELAPGFGYFAADGVEFKVTLPLTFNSLDSDYYRSDYSETTVGVHLAGLYHLGDSETLVPFLGAGVGMSSMSDSADGDYETLFTLPSVHAGLRAFFSESACLTAELVYHRQNNGMYAEDVTANAFGIEAGLSIFS